MFHPLHHHPLHQSVTFAEIGRRSLSCVRSLLIGVTFTFVGCDSRAQRVDVPSAEDTVPHSNVADSPAGPEVASATDEGVPPSSPDESIADEVVEDSTHAATLAPSFRPHDQRPRHQADQLATIGIHEFASRRLLLDTDIEAEIANGLPIVIDRAYETWEAYFGPLPPARDGSDYQLTGYLMRDQSRFRQAGLLPVHLPPFAHGKHDAQQFWMNDSEFDYYRRHLMIHEATHCYMQSMGGTTRDVPVWYLEGMAEHFATHEIAEEGKIIFGVMPDAKENFLGFGRIQMIQRSVADGRLLSIDQITGLQPQDFIEQNESYAWAWALCHWADSHPRYRDPFGRLAREYVAGGFQPTFDRLFAPLLADLDAEWTLFARHLCYGYDIERAAMTFESGVSLDEQGESAVIVRADRGWQSSGVAVENGQTYALTATGRTELAQLPRPWESEARGISIRYNEGRPLGRLLGLVISAPDTPTHRHVSEVMDLGGETAFTAPSSGTLFLRVNDFWNELADNTGEYAVELRVHRDNN